MGWDCVRGVPLNSHDAWSEVWRRCIGNLLRSSISSCQKKVLQLHCESPTSPASPSCRRCKTDQNRNVIWDLKVGFSWSYHHHVTMSCHVTFLVLDIGWFLFMDSWCLMVHLFNHLLLFVGGQNGDICTTPWYINQTYSIWYPSVSSIIRGKWAKHFANRWSGHIQL